MISHTEKNRASRKPKKYRFDYIDQFRGFVGVLMVVGHCSYYLNAIWLNLDPFDPLFPSQGQFFLRYAGYLCAPGFLMMAGAMVWWSYHRRRARGTSDWRVRWYLIQRGLFLVLVQVVWVNSSWGGFRVFQPGHLGIIASIGISVIFLTLLIRTHWSARLGVAVILLLIHPFLLDASYDHEDPLSMVLMQTFIDAGKFNKYPVMPWFALALLGSVMANGWLRIWKTDRKRIAMSLLIASGTLTLAVIIRLVQGYGNIFPHNGFLTWSFLVDQKYPPSLFMNLWAFASVVLGVSLFIAIGKLMPNALKIFSVPGKVPLFFYAVHLAILGIFVKRVDFFYRDGGIVTTLVGVVVMLVIMLPLCNWFYKVKLKSNNYFIRMI